MSHTRHVWTAGDVISAGPLQALEDDLAAVQASPVAGHTATYLSGLNVYNLKPKHLRRVRAALGAAHAGTDFCRIACLGTSITSGQGLTPRSSNAWPYVLRNVLTAQGVPLGGTGPVLAHNGDSNSDDRWAFVGSWTKFNPGATDKTVLYSSSTAGATATFTGTLAGTVVDVLYSNASGPFTVAIDGAAAVTVTPAGGTAIATYTVTGLANTAHSIVIARTSGTLYLSALEVRGTSGLRVANMGFGGARLQDFQFADQPYLARNFATGWAPHLLTLAVMTNEANTGISAAAFQTQLEAFAAAVQPLPIDVLLIAEIDAGNLDLTGYRAALYTIADEYDLPILDMTDRWGPWATAAALGMMYDNFHPTAAGQHTYGRAVASLLTS